MWLQRSACLSGFALSLVFAVLTSAPAAAGQKGSVTGVPLTEEELSRFSGTLGGGFSCVLGVTNPPQTSLRYIIPPDDQFYTFLQPPQCVACAGTNSARLSTAHVVLNFVALCSTVPIEYSIVAADTGCAEPVPGALLCGPTLVNLVPPTLGLQDFALPLPDSCQFTGSAFLCIKFISFPPECNTQTTSPHLVLASGGCPECRSYNFFETEKDDLCKEPDRLSGQPIFYAEATSCFVPALARTWGSLKIRYR